jgi:hypothetical protein
VSTPGHVRVYVGPATGRSGPISGRSRVDLNRFRVDLCSNANCVSRSGICRTGPTYTRRWPGVDTQLAFDQGSTRNRPKSTRYRSRSISCRSDAYTRTWPGVDTQLAFDHGSTRNRPKSTRDRPNIGPDRPVAGPTYTRTWPGVDTQLAFDQGSTRERPKSTRDRTDTGPDRPVAGPTHIPEHGLGSTRNYDVSRYVGYGGEFVLDTFNGSTSHTTVVDSSATHRPDILGIRLRTQGQDTGGR